MKTYAGFIAVALLSTGCEKNERVEAVKERAEQRAEATKEAAEKTADRKEEAAEQRKEAVEKHADAMKEQAQRDEKAAKEAAERQEDATKKAAEQREEATKKAAEAQPPGGPSLAKVPGSSDYYQTAADKDVAQRLRAAIEADDRTDDASDRVQITASAGHVTLSGSCHSKAEHDALLDKANAIAGKANVVDDLKVHP